MVPVMFLFMLNNFRQKSSNIFMEIKGLRSKWCQKSLWYDLYFFVVQFLKNLLFISS